MIARIHEHGYSIARRVIQIKNGITINANLSVNNNVRLKKILVFNGVIIWITTTGLHHFKSYRYSKSIVGYSVIVCDENIIATDSVSTNVTNTVPTNVTSAISINYDDKKIRYKTNYFLLHTFY